MSQALCACFLVRTVFVILVTSVFSKSSKAGGAAQQHRAPKPQHQQQQQQRQPPVAQASTSKESSSAPKHPAQAGGDGAKPKFTKQQKQQYKKFVVSPVPLVTQCR